MTLFFKRQFLILIEHHEVINLMYDLNDELSIRLNCIKLLVDNFDSQIYVFLNCDGSFTRKNLVMLRTIFTNMVSKFIPKTNVLLIKENYLLINCITIFEH